MRYIFFLGNAPDLATAELQSVLGRNQTAPAIRLSNNIALLEIEQNLAPDLFSQLGGTVKVGGEIGICTSEENIISYISSHLLKLGQPKIDFGLSFYLEQKTKLNGAQLSKEIKKMLQPEVKARFVLPNFPAHDLSSVVIKKQHLIDFSIVEREGKFLISKTIWVQDFEDWGLRDYGRPKAEGHIGMLPPKVARMMVNLAFGQDVSRSKADIADETILDPFCGVGTILAEGLVLGVGKAIGGDIDPKQIDRTNENLAWLIAQYQTPGTYKTHVTGAQDVSKVVNQKVDAIVTEPDLGPNVPGVLLDQTQRKLENLYLSCLENWKEILLKGGVVVIALPSFVTSSRNISNYNDLSLVKTILDKAKIMGYSVVVGPLEYSRPQAKVRRNICVLNSNL